MLPIYFNEQPTSIKFSYSGKILSVGTKDGFLRIFDINNNKNIYSLKISKSRLGV